MRVKLTREIGFGNCVIMRGEMIALVTERTDPDLSGKINAGEGVEGGGAGLTAERGVGESRDIRVRTDHGDGGSKRDDALAGFNLASWPYVPRHPNSVYSFGICARNFRHPHTLINDDSIRISDFTIQMQRALSLALLRCSLTPQPQLKQ